MLNEIEARYEKAVEQAREAIEELRLAALAKGYEDAERDLQAVAPTPKFTPITAQEHRDEIIEQAKLDVMELSTTERFNSVPTIDGEKMSFYPISNSWYEPCAKVDFVINRDKRTVVALIKWLSSEEVWAKGIAKCAPTDCFNVHIGKAIALRRALGLEVPAEYLNAPQPTEVRVGDVVCGNQVDGFYLKQKRFTLTSVNEEDGGFYYAESKTDWIEHDQIGRIIDDSRE